MKLPLEYEVVEKLGNIKSAVRVTGESLSYRVKVKVRDETGIFEKEIMSINKRFLQKVNPAFRHWY